MPKAAQSAGEHEAVSGRDGPRDGLHAPVYSTVDKLAPIGNDGAIPKRRHMPETVRIVVLGGGYGGVEATKVLERQLGRRRDIQITLIDRNSSHTLMTELHEVAGGRVEPESVQISFRKIFGARRVDAGDGHHPHRGFPVARGHLGNPALPLRLPRPGRGRRARGLRAARHQGARVHALVHGRRHAAAPPPGGHVPQGVGRAGPPEAGRDAHVRRGRRRVHRRGAGRAS